MTSRALPRSASLALLFAGSAFTLSPAQAAVKLPALISDNMVLQQEARAHVWGWADPKEKVTVTFAGRSISATADGEGKWSGRLADLKGATTGDMTITGTNSITIKNVAVGEVWVCSGQSNMAWMVSNAAHSHEEISAANFPLIRMFTVAKTPHLEPQNDCQGKWEVCSPQTVGNFSAVGYFFGRKLYQTLQQPIGLIHSSWGGTEAELWTPRFVLAADPELKSAIDNWDKVVAAYPQARDRYEKEKAAWEEARKVARAEGKEPPRAPRAPRGDTPLGSPSCLYNGMIAPLLPYTIQGAIWYQGESNASRALQYRRLFPRMILSWRRAWATGGLAGTEMPDFPFLYVQLANYMQRQEQPTDSDWARLREAQLMTLELPRTGMAVTIDIGEVSDIHPRNKQEVGRRLALPAEATVYYRDQEFSGPIYAGAQFEEGRVRLSFRHADGLKSSDGGPLKGFAVAGADRKFHWAQAEIQGDHIVVSAREVAEPAAVRYAWADNPICNLVNSASLPASPFRSDDWPRSVISNQ